MGHVDARFVADDHVNPAARTDSSLTLSTVVFIGPLQNLIWPEVGTAIKAPTLHARQNFSAMVRRTVMRGKQLWRAICELLVVMTVTGALVIVAPAACFVPARRAVGIQPATVLRND